MKKKLYKNYVNNSDPKKTTVEELTHCATFFFFF